MAHELLNNGDISGATPGWEAILNNNTHNLLAYIKTFYMQSSAIGGGRQVAIQLRDAENQPVTAQELLRIRLSDAGNFNVTSDAVSLAVAGGTLVESIVPNKDIIVKSLASGLFVVNALYASGSYRLNIGPALVYPVFANYHNYIELV